LAERPLGPGLLPRKVPLELGLRLFLRHLTRLHIQPLGAFRRTLLTRKEPLGHRLLGLERLSAGLKLTLEIPLELGLGASEPPLFARLLALKYLGKRLLPLPCRPFRRRLCPGKATLFASLLTLEHLCAHLETVPQLTLQGGLAALELLCARLERHPRLALRRRLGPGKGPLGRRLRGLKGLTGGL